MKKLLFILTNICLICSLFLSCTPVSQTPVPAGNPADSFKVSVTNGYGTGNYKIGDTVHIWSRECASNETFDFWNGDTTLINQEWHSWFIMPAKNVAFSASFKTVSWNITYEKIKAVNNLKNVYYIFPPGQIGIVYLFHGANGSASYWVNNYEPNALIKDLVANGYAVIITEAEEVTLNQDTNGDGELRWVANNLDSVNNIDFANLKAITDTFYNRKLTSRNKPRYCIGQSNGGSCSIAFATTFNLTAAAAYCAAGGAAGTAVNTTKSGIQFCLEQLDNNSTMGLSGNISAINNSQSIQNRGVCSKYFINIASPLYPERFARNTLISKALSGQIFTEIQNAGLLKSNNKFIGYASNLWNAVKSSPQKFPVTSGLSVTQQNIVTEQLNCITTAHQFFSDHDKLTMRFFNNPCY